MLAQTLRPEVDLDKLRTTESAGLLANLAAQRVKLLLWQDWAPPAPSSFPSPLRLARSHAIALGAHRWPDHARLSDIEPRFVCAACGRRGADVRPDWQTVDSQLPARAPISPPANR
jgi:hypothetical protein